MILWCAILSANMFLFRDSYVSQVRLFNFIAEFGHVGAKHHKFQKTNGMLKADEPHTFGFPSLALPLMRVDINTNSLQINIYANSRC